jgi:hypothetical protein
MTRPIWVAPDQQYPAPDPEIGGRLGPEEVAA